MARVLYGYNKKSTLKPFVIIYQKYWKVGDSENCNKYTVVSERDCTDRELVDIVYKMKEQNRVYHYKTIEHLVDDDLRSLVNTPNDIINNLITYERTKT